MSNELLAVVDERDRIIDHRPRGEIHALSLPHRAVHILVFNDGGQLLLQKRSLKKDLNKGLWDTSAAGHVDQGEDYATCAPRELEEELGVSAALTALFKLEPSPDSGMEFIQVYECRHNGPFVFAVDEIDEICWSARDEVNQRVDEDDATLTKTFKIIWRHYRAF
ncbi:MAG: NUDIX domain-containing protein [Methylomonas sp.]|jgi:isopentenyldiphosphate isomerase|uniref:NUDIX hydrolase n=1 Tax=Methylomonas sp. TaxID=418 RepID=UPI0025D08DB9|nr:NUDIX domain-containing protein [Methylomonas sp.]MCK9604969.1 NUDIX domain-containing protein [Methylomonas sp.]